ncbi:hypothetical protein [Photorhabdus heterorhabditis]|uniref:hypothetical protein n=1 Tax=Photorhabdus heterorhabditis TaxID=880156 RepID=UPI000AA6D084|nr:hypothetical protein [Photorhabdus heterorhabditis]
MLRHSHSKNEIVKLTLPDGRNGIIIIDRSCNVLYDFPFDVKIVPVSNSQAIEKMRDRK